MTAQYVGTLTRPNASYTLTSGSGQAVVVAGSALAAAMRTAPVNFVPGHALTAANASVVLGCNVSGAINIYVDVVSYKGLEVSKSNQGLVFGHEVLHTFSGLSHGSATHNAEFSAASLKLSGNGGGVVPGTNRALDLGSLPTITRTYFLVPFQVGGTSMPGSGGGGGK